MMEDVRPARSLTRQAGGVDPPVASVVAMVGKALDDGLTWCLVDEGEGSVPAAFELRRDGGAVKVADMLGTVVATFASVEAAMRDVWARVDVGRRAVARGVVRASKAKIRRRADVRR